MPIRDFKHHHLFFPEKDRCQVSPVYILTRKRFVLCRWKCQEQSRKARPGERGAAPLTQVLEPRVPSVATSGWAPGGLRCAQKDSPRGRGRRQEGRGQ